MKSPAVVPICVRTVDDLVWTFERGGQRLEIRREETETGTRLMLTSDGAPRTYRLTIQPSTAVSEDMESHCCKPAGLSLFSPDRRTGRTQPRLNERRRWWTDGLRAVCRRIGSSG
jgi:hypothetical protein